MRLRMSSWTIYDLFEINLWIRHKWDVFKQRVISFFKRLFYFLHESIFACLIVGGIEAIFIIQLKSPCLLLSLFGKY